MTKCRCERLREFVTYLHHLLVVIICICRMYMPNVRRYISQGSVAMQLRCGVIFNRFIANFPQNVPVKEFLKIG